jgi:phage regulator Rha-like protein
MQNNENFSGNTNLFPTTIHEGVQVVDSRLIAEALGLPHSSWFTNIILKHQNKIKAKFGVFHFQNGKPQNGRPERYCYLTEDQAIFVGTLSRNTEQVVDFKALVVASFSQSRRQVQEAKALLESVQGNASPLQEIATLRQEVSFLRQELHQNMQLMANNFAQASIYFSEIQDEIDELKDNSHQNTGEIGKTVLRVDKIEERLDFKADAYVYIMYCPRKQWYKLGSSHDTKGRKKDFATIEPNLQILIEIPMLSRLEAYNFENTLKKRFSLRHKEGEWYLLLPEDIEYLHEVAQSNRIHLLRIAEPKSH